jgi:hypothetical protein
MKNIIQSIFGVKDAIKSNKLTAWLGQLEELDDIAALQFSAHQLTQTLNRADGEEILSLQQQLELLLEIEVLNQARLEKLSTQFSSVENLKTELANNICEACYNYCRQSYICHLKIIEKLFGANKINSESHFKLEGKIPSLIIARALQATFNMIKWRLFSQSNPPASVWLQIFVLYRIASQQMLINNSIEVFKSAPMTTLAAYFVQVWMLGQLAQASLQKYQIEIAARILNTLLTRTYISSKLTPEQYVFYIDLEKDAAAKRMRNFEPNERCRYWELDELEKQMAIAFTVSDRGEIPQSLEFSKIDNPRKLNETLKALLDEWQKSGYVRQRRKFARQSSSKNARVNAGIADICKQVHQTNQISSGLSLSRDGRSLEDRLRAHTVLRQSSSLSTGSGSLDTWIITDESTHGLGARVNKFGNILVRPDKLIGLVFNEDPGKIIIGMIRSAKPTQGDQLRVGVEVISYHPTWVQLRKIEANESYTNIKTEIDMLQETSKKNLGAGIDMGLFSGIYLPIEAGHSDSSTLILPKINFRANANYAITIAGSPKHVLLGQAIESRDDWVKVAFPF